MVANPLYQSEMYKNLLIYSNFLSIMQVIIHIQLESQNLTKLPAQKWVANVTNSTRSPAPQLTMAASTPSKSVSLNANSPCATATIHPCQIYSKSKKLIKISASLLALRTKEGGRQTCLRMRYVSEALWSAEQFEGKIWILTKVTDI